MIQDHHDGTLSEISERNQPCHGLEWRRTLRQASHRPFDPD
jgi:hypothetical protein